MLKELEEKGRREHTECLRFWKKTNVMTSIVNPVPFNKLARAVLSAQTSSTSAERSFSDLGRIEGRQSQSILTGTLEMREVVQSYVRNELEYCHLPQSRLLHPRAEAFRAITLKVAKEVVYGDV